MLTLEIQISRGFVGQNDLEAERFEKPRPHGKLFVHTELQRKPDLAARTAAF